MRVQLVNPSPERFWQSAIMNSYPPLGILSVASYLKHMTKHIEVGVLDASIMNTDEIESALDADVIGISTTIGTYRHALRIAAKAKRGGARVVLGGPYASVLAAKILSEREFVDCVVVGDGEEAFYKYVTGAPLCEIDNLVFRQSGQIIQNSVTVLDVSRLPMIDFEFVNVERYFANFRRAFSFLGEKLDSSKELSLYSRKGCTWRLTGGCLFCSIFDRTYRIKSPGMVWTEIKELSKRYGINGVYDVSDEFLSNLQWLKEFAAAKKEDVYFVLMGRTNLITDSSADLLSSLNCVRIFLGIESGDQRMLDNMNKRTTVQENIEAVRLLSERGIRVSAGVVLGAPGENSESLENTMHLFDRLISFGNLDVIDPNVLIPLPGSPSFSRLLSVPEMREKYEDKDVFDAEELQRDWVRYFCDIYFEDLRQAIDVMRGKVRLSLY
jgi:anaerobic magnesium-protoporphyrin IX monomethyl ester cyclase